MSRSSALAWWRRLAVLLVVLAIPLQTVPAQAADDWDVPNGHFFTQTGGGGGRGYSVTDEGGVRFWSEFQRLGGVQAVGYPASQRFQWDGFTVQVFQRVVFQWRPEQDAVAFVNVFDRLHDLGKDDFLLKARQTPPPRPFDDAGKAWDQVVANHLAVLDAWPALAAAYRAAAPDPVQANGLPVSDVADMGNNYALRAQRVVFQLWKEDVPWARKGQVTVALGGDIAKEAGILPDPDALRPIAAPTGAQPGATPAPPSAAPTKASQARGLFVITQHDEPVSPATLDNPSVDGIVVRTFWSDVEPADGQFNWGFLDGQVQAAANHGKKVDVIVLPGAFTPDWALAGVQVGQFSSKYGFSRGDNLRLPMPWDQTYLARWFGFVKALGQRYDQNPAVALVPVTGPTSISAEMSLPNDDVSVAQWRTLGYTPDKFLGAWDQALSAYAQAFPNTQLAMTLYPGLPIPTAGSSDQTRQDAVALAVGKYPGKVALQTSGLSARKEDHPRLGYQLLQQNASRTVVGFEMGTSASAKPERMGGGDAVSALRRTIDFGLAGGARYLIVYEKDVLNPATQADLQYAHAALVGR
ncbi:MAG TPA: beta-galactosidase [Chloroflexota bacterium]|nr:beta-galactosidase [Chloroflexota bacterium]